MKKSIIMTIIVAMVLSLVSFASIVNAADNTAKVSLSVDKTSVKKGDTVTVTVSSDKSLAAARFSLSYDTKFLKVKDAPNAEYNTTSDGTVFEFLMPSKNVNSVTITFEVTGSNGSTKISATPIEFASSDTEDSEYTVNSISGAPTVKIKEETTNTPSTPSTSTPSKTTTSSSAKPTKYPSTGYSVVALGASVIAIIALGAISVKVFKK